MRESPRLTSSHFGPSSSSQSRAATTVVPAYQSGSPSLRFSSPYSRIRRWLAARHSLTTSVPRVLS